VFMGQSDSWSDALGACPERVVRRISRRGACPGLKPRADKESRLGKSGSGPSNTVFTTLPAPGTN